MKSEINVKTNSSIKILVTGGAGFVGSNLCERLAKNPNNEVYSLDNYSSGSVDNHVPNVIYIKGNTIDIEQSVNDIIGKLDIIYHLGEYSRVEQSFDDIGTVTASNISGTLAVLEYVRKSKVRLIYAGSSTKFGLGGVGTNSSPYAFTKSSNTQLVQNYGDWFGIDYAITYFYNVYGPREIKDGSYATVIAKFTNNRKLGILNTVTLPGTQLRNFTHVDDIVDGLILVGEKGSGDGYGIGSSDSYSILDIVNLIGGEIQFTAEKRGNRLSAKLETEKTIALGWQAKRKLIEYINNNNNK